MEKDNPFQDTPSERTMRNWLATWRSLNHDLQQLQKSAKEFEQFIELATNQIECYQNILKERKFYNYKFFKNVTHFGEKHLAFGDLLDKIISLKDEILGTESNLEEFKLELQGVQKKLIPTAAKSQLASKSLAESIVIYGNLKKRNLLLQAVKGEAMELYRSRDQMFDYQLIEKALELLHVQSKTKAIQDASKRLQT